MKLGANNDVLFSHPGFNTIGDTYQGMLYLITNWNLISPVDPHKLKKFNYTNKQNYTPEEYTAWKQND
jgi:hypothetical protein